VLRKFCILVGALVALGTQASHAQDSPLWKNVGNWTIRVDKTLNYGCFMLASYTRGTVVRIGIDQQNLNGYIVIGNEAWRSLEAGKQYGLSLQFDNDTPWRGNATARSIGGDRPIFLYLPFSKPDFRSILRGGSRSRFDMTERW